VHELLGAAIAFALAVITAPVGVSGAVLLLPVQIGLLGVPSPSVTPTNLLYNVFATPGGLWRYRQEGRLRGPLARTLLQGTLPGVLVGVVVRVELLSGPRAFQLVIACVLGPLGAWLALSPAPRRDRGAPPAPGVALRVLAFAVGVVGGVYGIGGGSILAPLLLTAGYSVIEIAGPALLSTFVTSVVGIVAFEALALHHGGGETIAPDWSIGIAVGLGGLAGSYTGARLQSRLPEAALRRLLGVLALAIALRSLWVALS
jgi:uncharacterized membrane protein YfcA